MCAEELRGEFDGVALPQKQGRVACGTNAGRCARGDDIAGFQRNGGAQERNQERYFEEHLAGHLILQNTAVYLLHKPQAMRIGNFVARDKEGAQRAKGVGAFAPEPLVAIALGVPVGDIVEQGIAGDHLIGLRLGDPSGGLADDDREFGFAIHALGAVREHNRIKRPIESGGGLGKKDGRGGQLGIEFSRMRGVVFSQADNLARTGNRRSQANALGWNQLALWLAQ